MNESIPYPPPVQDPDYDWILHMNKKAFRRTGVLGVGMVTGSLALNLLFWLKIWLVDTGESLASVSVLLLLLLLALLLPLSLYAAVALTRFSPRRLVTVLKKSEDIIWVFRRVKTPGKEGGNPVSHLTVVTQKGASFHFTGSEEEMDRCHAFFKRHAPKAWYGFPDQGPGDATSPPGKMQMAFNGKQHAKEIEQLRSGGEENENRYYSLPEN